MTEEHEGNKAPESQEEEKRFINKFTRIVQEPILKKFEENNRAEIAESSLFVRDAFDQKWKKVTGNSYYQPTTTIQPVHLPGQNVMERSDPRSKKYRATVIFSRVMWTKIRRKISKKFVDLYILHGEVADTNKTRPIFQNLAVNRLKEVMGEKDAELILKAARNKDKPTMEGEIKGTFELEVEGYWEVQFSPQKDPNDPIDVRLMWEGQCLIIKRMVPVVLPGFYLEVADNSMRDHFIQTPKDGRKKIGTVQEYPYTVFRPAQMDEYLKQKSIGDKIMRDVRNRQDG